MSLNYSAKIQTNIEICNYLMCLCTRLKYFNL
nr:MAG TPA_asm: hypothetical protein [Caudoviricetes sp.]